MVGNEDSSHIQKYMHIALTAVAIVLTGRILCCLSVLSIKFTVVNKGMLGRYIANVAYSISAIDSGECCILMWRHFSSI
jgi:hypothetical protein